MKSSELRKEAREALQGKWGKGVSIILAYMVVAFVIGFIIGLFGEESILGNILSIAELIISIPLSFGLAFVFLKLKRNENVKAFDFVKIAIDNFSRAWCITGRTALKMILPIIVLVGSILIYAVTVVYSIMQLSLGASETLGLGFIVGIVVYIAAMIYFVSVSLLYSLTSLIAYDNKDMSASEVVNESAKLMKGNRWKIVLLELSFIGWAILGIFILGIGYLWLIPYMQVAMVCFYDRLIKSKENVDVPTNDEPIKEM